MISSGWIKALIASALMLCSMTAMAQVCAAPGKDGTTYSANTYFPGVGSANAGTTVINYGAARIDLNASSTNFAVGDLALVIQIQDAAIDNTNTGAYGDGVAGDPGTGSSNLRSAGFYEFKRVTAVTASSINIDSGLANTYTSSNATTTDGNRRFQVVRVPQLASASLPAGTTTVPAWDGTTGGLIVVDASGTLNLNGAVINANGSGFRGGGSQTANVISGVNTLDYRAAQSATNDHLGGPKGEGIAGTPRFVKGPTVVNGFTGVDLGTSGYPNSFDLARGAPGNAGGGGTQHNSGGGGGGNAGNGGNGGNSFGFYSATDTGGCVNFGAGFFSCTGDGSRAVGGYGGTGLAPVATRIFLGGGGGAGENNNANDNPTVAQGSGGNGGGLVFIRARFITGSATINTNGEGGQPAGRDAGGGGGAGGTVVLVSETLSVPGLVVNANGGVGGNTGLPLYPNETQGTGGGGGGGAVIRSVGLTTGAANVAGGASGLNQPVTAVFNALNAASGSGGFANVNFTGTQISNPASCYPQLTVTKRTTTPTRTVPPDTTAQYTVNVSNAAGVGAATGVAVTDALPAPFTLSGATANAVFGGGSLGPAPSDAVGTSTVTIASPGSAFNTASFFIPPGGDITLTFNVALNGADPGTYQNPANVLYSDPSRTSTAATITPGATYAAGGTVGGSNYASASTTNDDVVIRTTANLSITKTDAITTVKAGKTTTYTITVANTGPGNAPNTLVKDPVAAGLNCKAATCAVTAGTAACPSPTPTPAALMTTLQTTGATLTSFNAGATVTFSVTCDVTATGQ
jgi:uncharacterized repeat protein (TIGR01451 family)